MTVQTGNAYLAKCVAAMNGLFATIKMLRAVMPKRKKDDDTSESSVENAD